MSPFGGPALKRRTVQGVEHPGVELGEHSGVTASSFEVRHRWSVPLRPPPVAVGPTISTVSDELRSTKERATSSVTDTELTDLAMATAPRLRAIQLWLLKTGTCSSFSTLINNLPQPFKKHRHSWTRPRHIREAARNWPG